MLALAKMQISAVTRIRPAMPSKLATFLACPLQYALETEPHGLEAIKYHPAVFLGTAVHDAAELLREKEHVAPGDWVQMLEARIRHLVRESANAGPLTQWVLDRYGITGLVSRSQLLTHAGFARTLAERFPSQKGFSTRRSGDDTSFIAVGREKQIASSILDISGRADAIYWVKPGRLRIVDFKTGKVTNDQGNPKENYLLQVAAYGRVAKELDPAADIELELLGSSDSWTGSLDAALIAMVNGVLQKLRITLPLGMPLAAKTLSRRGPHCARCSYRSSCEEYREHLEELMAKSAFDYECFGIDLVGELLEIRSESEFSVLRIHLKNGRTARISRIPTQLIPQSCVIGRKITAYGLTLLEPRRPNAFPCNFSVIDIQTPRNSSFQFAIKLD